MGARRGNEKIIVYYGQVCIVPKWLGDKVGWWGDYLYTYGGDNELSCNVLELGYAIEPITCACISDRVHKDELRAINAATRNDTNLFREKWPLGPSLPRPIARPRVERKYRLLYAPIYEPGNMLQKHTKYGLLHALQKQYNVTEVDYLEKRSYLAAGLSGMDDLYYVADAYKPDIFLLQIQDSKHIDMNILNRLLHEHPRSKFISWNGDYSPRNLQDPTYRNILKKMDLATFVCADQFPLFKKDGINCAYWQIGYEEFQELPLAKGDKSYDVIFQGNEYSEDRTYLGHILREMKGLHVGIFGFWRSLKADGASYYDYAVQDKLYRSSKICISDQQFKKSEGYVSNRIFQAMHSGCFVLQQRINGIEKYLSMKDGTHLVQWDDVSELPELIQYWLDNDRDRIKIAKEGKKLVDQQHNFGVRVQEFNQFVGQLFRKG
jgi:glycosyltransferase involved in cell wall biosynthesis